MTTQIQHPNKICIPVETALADWTGPGGYQVKLDGVFAVREVAGGILVGEDVRGEFTAFDCVEADGQDVRGLSLAQRLRLRDTLCHFHGIGTVRTVWSDGAGLLREVLAAGLEGVVLKSPGGYGETMIAAKRSIVVVCRVTGIGPGQSIAITDAKTGADLGRCPAKGGKADTLRVGDCVRIEAMNITEAGKLRQPQLCREFKILGN